MTRRGSTAVGEPLARLVGADTIVACVGGPPRRYMNLDHAASTQALAEVCPRARYEHQVDLDEYQPSPEPVAKAG